MNTLSSLVSLQVLHDALHIFGYPVILLIVFIESTGLPIPGETMLLLASFYAGADQQLQLPFIIACAAFGAIMGDNLGYYIGYKGGRAFAERFGQYVFLKTQHLDKAEQFFVRHGAKTVFFGRFIVLLRIWAAFLAGMNKMHWHTFLLYNSLGGIVWATSVGVLGYLAGRMFHDHFDQVERLVGVIGWTGLAVVLILSVVAFIVYRLQRSHRADIPDEANNRKTESEEPLCEEALKVPSSSLS